MHTPSFESRLLSRSRTRTRSLRYFEHCKWFTNIRCSNLNGLHGRECCCGGAVFRASVSLWILFKVFGRVELVSLHVTIINFRNGRNSNDCNDAKRWLKCTLELIGKIVNTHRTHRKRHAAHERLDKTSVSLSAYMTCKTVIGIDAKTN